jgi:hypothetical protein
MRQNSLRIGILFVAVLVIFGCASSMKRKYTKKDHFMVGKYEVGAIEYEIGGGEDNFTLWSFPVYLNGQKVKTYHFLTQSVSDVKIQREAMGKSHVQVKEWTIQEESIDGNAYNIKKYADVIMVDYSTVKQEIVNLLKKETP